MTWCHCEVIFNIHQFSYIFFSCVRTFKIYSPQLPSSMMILLTTVTMLYILSSGFIYIIVGSSYVLTTFIPPTHSETTSLFFLYMRLYFWIPHASEILKYFSCLFEHILLYVLAFPSIHVAVNSRMSFLWLNIIPLCLYTQCCLYPSSLPGAHRLFSYFDGCK